MPHRPNGLLNLPILHSTFFPGLEGKGGEGSCKGQGLRLLGVAVAVHFIPEAVEALLSWVFGSCKPLKGCPMGGGSIIPSRPGALGPMSVRRCTKSLPMLILKGVETSTSHKAARSVVRSSEKRQSCT